MLHNILFISVTFLSAWLLGHALDFLLERLLGQKQPDGSQYFLVFGSEDSSAEASVRHVHESRSGERLVTSSRR